MYGFPFLIASLSFKATSALKASLLVLRTTGSIPNALIASSKSLYNFWTRSTPALSVAFSLLAIFSASAFALSNACFLVASDLLYLSVTSFPFAYSTRSWSLPIRASRLWALVTISLIVGISSVASILSIKSAFWALFKCGKFSISFLTASLLAFESAYCFASSTILSICPFVLAPSIKSLKCFFSSSVKPGIASTFLLASSLTLSASALFFSTCFFAASSSALLTIAAMSFFVFAAVIWFL